MASASKAVLTSAAAPKQGSTQAASKVATPARVLPDYANIFTVLAGPERAPFLVHKDRLCRDSDFFVKACSRAWQKDEKKEVPVEGVEPSIMALYIHWKYEHRIDLDLVPDPRAEKPVNLAQWILDEQKLEHEISQLIRLYVAGDMLLDNSVINEVIDELAIRSERMKDESCMFVDSEHIPYVWEHTGVESGLRTFMLDSCAARANLDPTAKETYPSDFFVELACRQMELRDCMSAEYNPTVSGRCQYHEHPGPSAAIGLQQCAKREKSLQLRVNAKPALNAAAIGNADSSAVKKRKRESGQ
ncbi:hypothetical protein LTR17_021227 [Elasticomyces elasticus]|nr:hypothetical protein LTR17_021227 [Elasticomyces elasticus]